MPELPEVEAVCRKLRREAVGASVLQLRVERAGIVRPQEPQWIETHTAGRRIEAVERRGKNILLHLSGGWALHVHLRMTGNLYVVPDIRFRPTAVRVWLELDGGRGVLFEDQRALGKVHLVGMSEIDKLLGDIGLEPLSEEFTSDKFRLMANGSGQPAKLFLMDQRKVAGLGNIYAAEALFRAGVDPRKPVRTLSKQRLARLYDAIREVLEEAVESAEAAYAEPGRFAEGEWFPCAVYGREGEPCPRCAARVRRIVQGGRSTYFCGRCQR